jgi:hypothetical protein
MAERGMIGASKRAGSHVGSPLDKPAAWDQKGLRSIIQFGLPWRVHEMHCQPWLNEPAGKSVQSYYSNQRLGKRCCISRLALRDSIMRMRKARRALARIIAGSLIKV